MSAECSCDYGPPPAFYRQTRRTAAKQHMCDECCRAIQPREQYEHTAAKWEDSVQTLRTCARCLSLREWVQAHVPCLCWMHHSLIEDCINTAKGHAHEAPGLWFGTLRRIVAINRAQEL